jgi:probable HAF family extracellular repeat protein
MMHLRRVCFLAYLLLGSAPLSITSDRAVADSTYIVTDLGTLSRPIGYSYGYAINSAGQATGYSSTTTGPVNAFLWEGNGMRSLGTLDPSPLSSSVGNAINSLGQVVGYSTTRNGDRAFLFSNNVMYDIHSADFLNSYAKGVNDAGQVTGFFDARNYAYTHAFLYENGRMRDLGVLGVTPEGYGLSDAFAINNKGQVVGYSTTTTSGVVHAFLYDDGQMHDLGALGGSRSEAHAINDAGQVVGNSTMADGTTHPFLYDAAGLHDLGFIGAASGINNHGDIIGSTGSFFFLFSQGRLINLTELISDTGFMMYGASGINDAGQIVGTAARNGQVHAIILSPVPEPSSWVLFGSALVLCGAASRLR